VTGSRTRATTVLVDLRQAVAQQAEQVAANVPPSGEVREADVERLERRAQPIEPPGALRSSRDTTKRQLAHSRKKSQLYCAYVTP
jgi:hypothetical protein